MKNLNLFGIFMILVMGMSFTSCSDDDSNGVSPETINELLEGEWFQVSLDVTSSHGERHKISWDFDNKTAIGECYCGYCDGSYEPQKWTIKSFEENSFNVTAYYYSKDYGYWRFKYYDTWKLNGNIIEEESYNEYGIIGHSKSYIKSISENTLVIVTEETYTFEDGDTYKDILTRTFRRNY